MSVWTVAQARVIEDNLTHLAVSPGSRWYPRLWAGFFLLLMGAVAASLVLLAVVTNSWGLAIVAAFFAGLAGLVIMTATAGTHVRFDKTAKIIHLHREPFISAGWRKKTSQIAANSDMTAEYSIAGFMGHTVLIKAPTERVVLQFGNHEAEAEQVLQIVKAAIAPPTLEDTQPNAVAVDLDAAAHQAMLRDIRSWGFWQLGLGAVHLFASGFLNAPWGWVLILVGLASFYFLEAAMYIIYATTIAWAGVNNLRSGQANWVIGGLFQFFLAFQIVQSFRRYRKSEVNLAEPALIDPDSASQGRAGRIFPWAAFICGGAAMSWFLLFGASILLWAIIGPMPWLGLLLGQTESFAINLGVLAIGLGLASLLCNFRFKFIAAIGLILGAIAIVTEFVLLLLL